MKFSFTLQHQHYIDPTRPSALLVLFSCQWSICAASDWSTWQSSEGPVVFGWQSLGGKKKKTQHKMPFYNLWQKRKTNSQLCGCLWRNCFHDGPPPPSGLDFDYRCPIAAPALGVLQPKEKLCDAPLHLPSSVACCYGNSRQWNGLSLEKKHTAPTPLLSLWPVAPLSSAKDPLSTEKLRWPSELAGYQAPLHTDRTATPADGGQRGTRQCLGY